MDLVEYYADGTGQRAGDSGEQVEGVDKTTRRQGGRTTGGHDNRDGVCRVVRTEPQ